MVDQADGVSRAHSMIERVEVFYLAALRVILLLLATLVLGYAAWLGVTGLYAKSRDASAVKETLATVSATDLAVTESAAQTPSGDNSADSSKAERAFYADFVSRYFALYGRSFDTYRRTDDAKLTKAAFDSRYVKSEERLDAAKAGDIAFDRDKADLEALLKTMTEAAGLDQTKARLKKYNRATKTKVTKTVSGTRSERYCSYYGYYIGECISYDTRQIPYRRTVTSMQLPAGVVAPPDLFQSYQDRYFELLDARRRDNAAAAESKRADIVADNLSGAARLWQALVMVGGFLAIMFLFLLIAIERHQRRMAPASLDGSDEGAFPVA